MPRDRNLDVEIGEGNDIYSRGLLKFILPPLLDFLTDLVECLERTCYSRLTSSP